MGILIKHSGNAAAPLVGAYGGGKGKRQAEDGRQAMQMVDNERQRSFAAQQAAQSRAQQAMLHQLAAKRADKARKAEIARQDALRLEGREYAETQQEKMRGWQIEDRESSMQRQDAIFDREIQARKDMAEFQHDLTTKGYTEQQKAEMQRIADAEAGMLQSDDFSDEEKKELRRRFAAKRAGIQPVQVPREESEAPDGPSWKDRADFTSKLVKDGMAFATTEEGFDQARFQQYIDIVGKMMNQGQGGQAEQPQDDAVTPVDELPPNSPFLGDLPKMPANVAADPMLSQQWEGNIGKLGKIEQNMRIIMGDQASVDPGKVVEPEEVQDITTAQAQLTMAKQTGSKKAGAYQKRLDELNQAREMTMAKGQAIRAIMARMSRGQ